MSTYFAFVIMIGKLGEKSEGYNIVYEQVGISFFRVETKINFNI